MIVSINQRIEQTSSFLAIQSISSSGPTIATLANVPFLLGSGNEKKGEVGVCARVFRDP